MNGRNADQEQKWKNDGIPRMVDANKSLDRYFAARDLDRSRQTIPWNIQGGLYRREIDGKKRLCVRAVIDSVYAAAPYVFEECGPLSGKKKKNYRTAMALSEKLNQRLKTKQPTCIDGLLVFPND